MTQSYSSANRWSGVKLFGRLDDVVEPHAAWPSQVDHFK